ncbi:MAG: sugar phosphate nucleotidyltransferase [Sphaerochaetaceae bacterium]
MSIHVILLSGGSGKRLWPLSNEIRSKQFLSLLPDGQGGRESMLQRTLRLLSAEFPGCRPVIATGESQYEQVRSQAGPSVRIVSEPARRDTFGAIALASLFLRDQCQAADDDVVAVLPIDAYAEQHYYAAVRRMCDAVGTGAAELLLMGIVPSHPSPRFGYMMLGKPLEGCTEVTGFVEKPSVERARQLIDEGASWNGGVFAFRLGHILQTVCNVIGKYDHAGLLQAYHALERISFDYAVVEKASSVAMVPYEGTWKDLGTWDALVPLLEQGGVGERYLVDSSDTVVVNELPIPVVALGTRDLIVAASADGILVTTAEASTALKAVADKLTDLPRSEQFHWGGRVVLDRTFCGSSVIQQTSRLDVGSDSQLTLSYRNSCTVKLICITGSGDLGIDGTTRQFNRGEHVSVEGRKLVTIRSRQGMQLMETVIETTNIFP